ncbi:MAG: hypothetical protein KAG61_13970 [Bacteriovoracaceae bacterium]|nr:hypothetical protein [Bacteriovoracaceae bacterium]
MSDKREFELGSPQVRANKKIARPKMGKVLPETDEPKLKKHKSEKKSRSTYVERDDQSTGKKTNLMAGFGSKLQIVLFVGSLIIIATFLAPHVIEFFNIPK